MLKFRFDILWIRRSSKADDEYTVNKGRERGSHSSATRPRFAPSFPRMSSVIPTFHCSCSVEVFRCIVCTFSPSMKSWNCVKWPPSWKGPKRCAPCHHCSFQGASFAGVRHETDGTGTTFVSQALLRHQARALRLFFRDGMSHLRVDVAFTRYWRACRLFRCNTRC